MNSIAILSNDIHRGVLIQIKSLAFKWPAFYIVWLAELIYLMVVNFVAVFIHRFQMAPFILTTIIKRFTPLSVNTFTAAFILISFKRQLLIVFIIKSTFIIYGCLFDILVCLGDVFKIVEVRKYLRALIMPVALINMKRHRLTLWIFDAWLYALCIDIVVSKVLLELE